MLDLTYRQHMSSLFSNMVLAGLTAAVFSCSAEVARSSSSPAPVAGVPFFTVDKGVRSGLGERKFVAIVTAKEWTDLWLAHRAGLSSAPQAAQVDFHRDMVVAVFLGDKKTGGYEIEVKRVEQDAGERVVVFWAETSPAPGAMVMQALTQPYHIVRLKKMDIPVVFVALTESRRRSVGDR